MYLQHSLFVPSISSDMVKVKFIQDAYTTTTDDHFLTTSTYPPAATHNATGTTTKPTFAANGSPPSAAAAANIQSVRDVLPDLQPAFVAALLGRYADSPEQVIAAVLEGNLPPDLLESDAPAKPAAPAVAAAAPAAPAVRSDPFGFGDAAGVIVKRNKGFPGQARTMAALLDDKTHVHQLRSRYQEWGLVAESPEDGQNGNDYDDEYDDSYDALAESERRSGATRATAVRNPNRAVRDELPDGDDDEEEDEEEEQGDEGQHGASGGRAAGGGGASSYYDKTKNFCENPEVARERRAQQWNNKWAARAPRKPAAAAGGGGAGGGGAAGGGGGASGGGGGGQPRMGG